jgi:hypothetical protein
MEMTMENCSQYVLAQAYITRHKLDWIREPHGGFFVGVLLTVDRCYCHWRGPNGFGNTLYEAVLDYQEMTGKGWGS